jgi:hypothetical protein
MNGHTGSAACGMTNLPDRPAYLIDHTRSNIPQSPHDQTCKVTMQACIHIKSTSKIACNTTLNNPSDINNSPKRKACHKAGFSFNDDCIYRDRILEVLVQIKWNETFRIDLMRRAVAISMPVSIAITIARIHTRNPFGRALHR